MHTPNGYTEINDLFGNPANADGSENKASSLLHLSHLAMRFNLLLRRTGPIRWACLLAYLLPSIHAHATTLPSDAPAVRAFSGTVRATVVQPDGKTLVGGDFNSYTDIRCQNLIVRLNRDGSVDDSFERSLNGKSEWAPSVVEVIALQPDGKILVGGLLGGSDSKYGGIVCGSGLVRLNPNGSLDTSFNPNKKGFSGKWAQYWVRALAIQSDNKIVVGGLFNSYNGNQVSDNIVRLNGDGTLDTSFKSGTGLSVEVRPTLTDLSPCVNALAVLDYGGILVGGRFDYYDGQSCPSGLMRLAPDGSYDSFFNGSNSFKGVSLSKKPGTVLALVREPGNRDRKIFVGGIFNQYNGKSCPGGVIRIRINGLLDESFNPGGSGASSDGGNSGDVHALALQTDGKIVIGGSFTSYNTAYNNSGEIPQNVIRLNSDGRLDETFNNKGAGANSNVVSKVVDLAIEADGKILIGGSFDTYNGKRNFPRNFLRLNSNGSPNTIEFYSDDLRNNIATGVITNASAPTKLFRFSANGFAGNYYEACAGGELYHNQHIVRLPNKVDANGNIHAYFMVAQSRIHQGYLSLLETSVDIDPRTDQIYAVSESTVGKIIWQHVFDDSNVAGNWNHPGRMEVSGGMLVVAAQNWKPDGCNVGNELGSSEDAVLFYDVRDPAFPRYLSKITASELGMPSKPRWNALNNPKREIAGVGLVQTANNDCFLSVSGNGVTRTFKCKIKDGFSWARKDWDEATSTFDVGQHGQIFAIKETPTSAQRTVYFDSHSQSRFEYNYYTYDPNSSKFNFSEVIYDRLYLPGASRDWDADGIYVPKSGMPIIYTAKSLSGSDIQIYQVAQTWP